MLNLCEMMGDDQHDAPCLYGNIVDGHACYCHSDEPEAPRKCPIWRFYGEELPHWNKKECEWFTARAVAE